MALLTVASAASATPSAAAPDFVMDFSQFKVGQSGIADVTSRLGPRRLTIRHLPGDKEVLTFWYLERRRNGLLAVTYNRAFSEHATQAPIPFVEQFYWHTLSDNLRVDFWFSPEGVLTHITSKVRRIDSAPDGLVGTRSVSIRGPLP